MIEIMKYTVQIRDLIDCITILGTGFSLCMAARMISTMSIMIVKAAKDKLMAAPILQYFCWSTLNQRICSKLTSVH